MSGEGRRRETKKLDDSGLTSRWIVRKGGVDFGPFNSAEILDMISSAELNERTPLFELNARRWCTLKDVRVFYLQLLRTQKKEEEKKRELSLEQETERVRKAHSVKSKSAFLLLGAVIIAAGAVLLLYFTYIKQPEETISLSIFKDPVVKRLEPFGEKKIALQQPLQDASKQPKIVKRPTIRPKTSVLKNPTDEEEEDLPVLDLDFSSSAGRTISNEDIQGVQTKSRAEIIKCFRDEAQRVPDFTGGKVSFILLPTGKISSVRIIAQNQVSPELLNCTRKSLKGISVSPFDGTFRRFEIPVYIQ